MISPAWQAAVRRRGMPWDRRRVFKRGWPGNELHQIVIRIDDTPKARAEFGMAVLDVIVNGKSVTERMPFELVTAGNSSSPPRLSLMTYATPHSGCRGIAVIDDFSVSIAVADGYQDSDGGKHRQ